MCSLRTGSFEEGNEATLIIDYVPEIERQLKPLDGKEVLLRVRITDECARNICTDRGPDVVPLQILRVY
jgi:hypothetical protein